MAFPTVQETKTSSELGQFGATSHTVALPGVVADDLVIICFSVNGTPTITWPTGWTEFFSKVNSSKLAIAYKKLSGIEPTTIIVTTSVAEQSTHASYRISGAEDPATQAPEASVGVIGTTATPDPDSLSPTGGSKDYLWIAIEGHDRDAATTGFPLFYTNTLNIAGGGSGGSGVGTGTRQLTAASENPFVFTLSGFSRWIACTVAIHPPSAGPPQSITDAGAIVSAEAFGTPTLLPGPVSILPTSISSVEAVGSPQILQAPPIAGKTIEVIQEIRALEVTKAGPKTLEILQPDHPPPHQPLPHLIHGSFVEVTRRGIRSLTRF